MSTIEDWQRVRDGLTVYKYHNGTCWHVCVADRIVHIDKCESYCDFIIEKRREQAISEYQMLNLIDEIGVEGYEMLIAKVDECLKVLKGDEDDNTI